MNRKRENFVRLAEKRVARAIKDLRLVGNLGNRNNYEFEEEHVSKIFKTLEHELRNARLKFEGTRENSEISFKLR